MKIRCEKLVVSGAVLLLAFFILFAFASESAFANSPKDVKLEYDESSQTLQASITHSPFSPGHYVEKVEVKKNGQALAVQEFKAQSAETFTYAVKISVQPGDVLEVKAYCSRFGSKSAKIAPASAK